MWDEVSHGGQSDGSTSRSLGINPGQRDPVTRAQRRSGAAVAIRTASVCLAEALTIFRCTQEDFAKAEGSSRGEVARWCDPTLDRTITAKRLLLASRTLPEIVLAYLASLGTHVQAPRGQQRRPLQTYVLLLEVNAGALASAALGMGNREEALRAIRDARRALDGIEAELRREGR